MAQLRTFTVEEILNLQEGKDRSLAFLICPEDAGIDAKKVFDGLTIEKQRLLRDRFDYWLQRGKQRLYFHGWDNPPYKNCFVFKWKEGRQHQRLYGFLIHPRPLTDNRLEVCVLVSHAPKNTEETNPTELNGANALRSNLDVVRAVKKTYPELLKGLKHGKPLDRKSVDDFVHRISFDFITQLLKRLESSPLSRGELATKLGVSKGRISQILNNPGNLTLRKAVTYARALGMKVSVMAYDDGDPDNEKGPISSEIFNICWENQSQPRDFDTASSSAALSETVLTDESVYVPRKGFCIVRKGFAATKQVRSATLGIGRGLAFEGPFSEQEMATTQPNRRAAGGNNG